MRAHPVEQRHVLPVEIFRIIARQIGLRRRHAPEDFPGIRLKFPHQQLKQRGGGNVVFAKKNDFIAFVNRETQLIENRHAVNRFAEVFDAQNVFSGFPVRRKMYIRIFARGNRQVVQLQFFKLLLARRGLFRFGDIGAETEDKRH